MVEQNVKTAFELSLSREEARVLRAALRLMLDVEDDVQEIEVLKRLLARLRNL